jgi:xylose isomerase
MAKNLRFGAGIWMFGQFVDRYATDAYGPPVDTLKAIDRAGEVGDLVALDVNYPFSDPDITTAQVKAALERNQLEAIAITPAIYTREFQRGSFTNPDAAIRRKTIELAKRAIEVAHELGAKYVKFWPGQDGHDYPFQADHAQLWEYAVSGVREIAGFAPQTQFAIEYKLKEPRVHITFSTASRTLLAIQEMGVGNVGIVLDFGHSLFAKETPADVLQLVHKHGKLTSVEVNDNWREWDDDLTVGSVHIIETMEFLHALRRINWEAPILLDQFPFREDPVAAARASIRTLKALDRLLDRVDLNQLKAAQDAQDALAAQRLIQDLLLHS